MAKVVAEFDTVEKTLSVTVDGTAVANVKDVQLCQGYDTDDFRCNLMTRELDEASNMWKVTQLCASQSKDHKERLTAGLKCDPAMEGFVKTILEEARKNTAEASAKLSADIAAFFKARKAA